MLSLFVESIVLTMRIGLNVESPIGRTPIGLLDEPMLMVPPADYLDGTSPRKVSGCTEYGDAIETF